MYIYMYIYIFFKEKGVRINYMLKNPRRARVRAETPVWIRLRVLEVRHRAILLLRMVRRRDG